MIERLDAAAFEHAIPALGVVLRDAVDAGASVGFLAGLSHEDACEWWRARAGAVKDGSLAVWVVREQDPSPAQERDEAQELAESHGPAESHGLAESRGPGAARDPVQVPGSAWTPGPAPRLGGQIVGTVSLAYPEKENSRHRAELIKLAVLRSHRGRGLGRRLLAFAEEAAAATGISLLMLDTETASDAESLYRRAGWQRYGIVPGYAADPAGVVRDCSFYFKRLG